jgi:hypothetical protein
MLAVAGPVEANPLWVIDVDSAMSVIGPIYPQLLLLWCSAANGRRMPILDSCNAAKRVYWYLQPIVTQSPHQRGRAACEGW